eukprot:Hpha_TRINITY_DN21212_c0_g1::TRINITY_DN21212_c0_g1_i1::g.171596::m.171596
MSVLLSAVLGAQAVLVRDGRRVASFPNYDDPITGQPALTRPSAPDCVVPLLTGAALESYSQIFTQAFPGVPDDCSHGPFSFVVLDFEGSVKGVQFDRFGGLWLGGVELLRTTTPEPSPKGIRWHVEKDLTRYAALFLGAAGENASLSIPNVIDSTYTGVLNINATLSFYLATKSFPARAVPTSVVPLRPPVGGAEWPWDVMAVGGGGKWDGAAKVKVAGGAQKMVLEVYASAHACEEFWYTNVPDSYVNSTGACGGGAARLLSVSVDGITAGVQVPFPVIYTGGVCPLLWRPISGIESFDIPPYTFDLSPFAGVFADGAEHEVTVSVLGGQSTGIWYVDPVLLVTHQKDAPKVVGGEARGNFKPVAPTVHAEGSEEE